MQSINIHIPLSIMYCPNYVHAAENFHLTKYSVCVTPTCTYSTNGAGIPGYQCVKK